MKRYFGILVIMSLSLLLFAQPVADVRTAQNIRYRGNVLKSSAQESWIFWEESAGSSYHIRGQKYNNLGDAVFGSPITVPAGTGSMNLIEAVATSDNGIVLLILQETQEQQVKLKVQKINSLGQAQWTENAIFVTDTSDYEFPSAKLCANNLGGAFLVYKADYGSSISILPGLNFDATGNNIWTAGYANISLAWSDLYQLLLTNAGELIINIVSNSGNGFKKVDNSGNIVGNSPMFAPDSVIPAHAKMQKGNDGKILIYSTDTYDGSPLSMQMMNADGNLVYSSLKQLPLGFVNDYGEYSGRLKFNVCSDGGFILAFLTSPSQHEDPRELRVQRLNAELEPIWGSENPLILSDLLSLMNLDMAVDASDCTWLAVVRTHSNYSDMGVEVLKLDPAGNPVWDTETVSISRQNKSLPRYALLADEAMLCWLDYHGDQISILRQIITANGEQLLPANGAEICSLLSGNPEVYGVYSLGNKTICLMQDDRGLARQIYYQILDSSLNQSQMQNGQALDLSDDGWQNIVAAKASPQNTLFVLHHKHDDDAGYKLYLQEIDAAGNRLYPGSGILLGAGEYSDTQATIGFENESAYVYWTYLQNDGNHLRLSIKGQRIVAGAIQWEAGGLSIYHQAQHDAEQMDAQGRYLVFSTTNFLGYPYYDIKAFRMDPTGSVDANWPAEGVSMIDVGFYSGTFLSPQAGVINDDLYCFISGIGNDSMFIKAQKLNTSGVRLWGDAGLQICESENYLPEIRTLLFDDEISILYTKEILGSFLQRLDTQGNSFFAGEGIAMPGNAAYNNSSQLARYANGVYSYFWADGSEDYQRYLKHVYISSSGSLQDIHLLREAYFERLHTAKCDNSVILYWTERYNDIFSWYSDYLISVYATAMTEPVANADLVIEPMPMVALSQNSPNPFTGSTRISYKLRDASPVKIQVFNIKGQLVHELPLMQKAAGENSWDWDGTDAQGQKCAAGIYLYKVRSGRYSASKKMILLH